MSAQEKRGQDEDLILQPVRYQVFLALKAAGDQGKYISQLARELHTDRRLVAFHLLQLRKRGLVENEYRILEPPSSKGKAANYFRLSQKGLDVARKVREELE